MSRSRRAMPSSFAKSDKTNGQTKVRVVIPSEVPHDTRMYIEDLVNTNVDESDVDEQESSANSRQKSELSEADFERDEMHRALKSVLETQVSCAQMSDSASFRIMQDLECDRRSSAQKTGLNDRTPSRTI